MEKSNLPELKKAQMRIFGFRRRNRRPDIRINMIPMINLAILLLIFFKVSAFYAPRPGRIEISLPTRYETYNPLPIPEPRLLRLFVDENDSFYYQVEKNMELPVGADFERLVKVIARISREVDSPVMLLKLDPRASYNSMVQVIGKIKSIEREINRQREIDGRINRAPVEEYHYSQIILRELSTADNLLLAQARNGRRN